MLAKLIATSVPVVLLTTVLLLMSSAEAVFSAPHGPHCVGSGPISSLPLDYCGCTWGGVYYRGQAIGNMPVTLSFKNQKLITATRTIEDKAYPIYTESGHRMGAKLNDVMTITTQMTNQAVVRPFRARPDGAQEQDVPLVVPEMGLWEPWLSDGYTRALATQGDLFWAAGSQGLISIDPTTNVSITHRLPWADPSVIAIAVNSSERVWVAGPQNLAEYDGAGWQGRSLPFAETVRTMVADPATGALWLAGWGSVNEPGTLAVYTGTWQLVDAIPYAVTSLAVDRQGDLWAGTWEGGVYRHEHTAANFNSGWAQYTSTDGLASDEIYDIAVKDGSVWFSTNGYSSGGHPLGGVSKFELSSATWTTFSSVHGLPINPDNSAETAPIYAIDVGNDGLVWIGTQEKVDNAVVDSIYVQIAPSVWVQDSTAFDSRIRSLAVVNDLVIAAGDSSLMKLDQSIVPGNPPTVQIHTTPTTIMSTDTLTMTATAVDNDENGGRILGWEWTSKLKGHLCTTAERCAVPGQFLGEGMHQIQLRVQDDEGVWSQPAQVMITVTSEDVSIQPQLYLPLVIIHPRPDRPFFPVIGPFPQTSTGRRKSLNSYIARSRSVTGGVGPVKPVRLRT